MRFSRNWIGEYVDLPGDEQLSEALSMLGLVVDDMQARGGDVILDLDIASNRPDLMNHLAVARELALALGLDLSLPAVALDEAGPAIGEIASVRIEEPEGCPRFVARALVDVRVGPSPAWLCERLESIGLRPINNVVDVTNFVMWELGRPMHAYDLDLLSGNELVARAARRDERLETLDEVERTLGPDDLVIADTEKAVGLAGVMGGEGTGVTDGTRRVLLECACFDARAIRAMARRHGMHTDASHRFERGLSTAGIMAATDRAIALIAELTGGSVARGAIDIVEHATERRVLRIDPGHVQRLLGVDVEPARLERILAGLGFGLDFDGDCMEVRIPAERLDITRDVDVLEEIARFYGYDNLPSTLPLLRRADSTGLSRDLRAERHVKSIASALGFWEGMSLAFTNLDEQRFFLDDPRLVPVANPLSEPLGSLRAHLLPSMIAAIGRNLNYGTQRVRLFELGRCFAVAEPAPIERRHLALAATGPAAPRHHGGESRPFDFADLKGAVDALLARMRWPDACWRAVPVAGLQEGSSARLEIEGGGGFAGRLDARVAAHFGVEAPVWVAEIDIHDLLERAVPDLHLRPLPRYPASARDVSLIVDHGVEYAALREQVAGLADLPLESMQLVDVYEGEDLPAGTAALTLRLTYRASDRTLTAAEVEAAHEMLVAHLERSVGARRR